MIRSRFPMCAICNEPVDLRTAKTNDEGQAVHEEQIFPITPGLVRVG